MTTELEEQFFKKFGIEPECVRGCGQYYFENGNIDAWNVFDCKNSDCSKCEHDKSIWRYPEITDRKLLEMICILNKEAIYGYSDWGGNFIIGETVQELKESILTDCIENKSKIFNQIQQLFKGEE